MTCPCRTLLLAALALLAVPVAASDEAPAPPLVPDDPTPLVECASAASLELASVLEAVEAPVCSVTPGPAERGLFVEPIEQKGPPIRRYCKCGCGITCTSDADCGEGGSCVAFVTCC